MNHPPFPFHFFAQYMLSVVVPVYNEGPHIEEHVRLLCQEVAKHFQRFEVIVVSDGSTDETNARLLAMQEPHVRPLIMPANRGKGAAVRQGLSEAQGEFVLFIDGGMELHPKEIKIFLGLMLLYEADIVVGSKRHPQSAVYYPWYRRFLSLLYQGLVRLLFKVNVTDTQVGIKMFRRQVVQDVLPHLHTDSYGFDLELLALAARFGHRHILEAPVRLDYFIHPDKRPLLRDLTHTFRVGLALLRDTVRLWLALRALPSLPERR